VTIQKFTKFLEMIKYKLYFIHASYNGNGKYFISVVVKALRY
jgi:hypothetical protein